MPSVSDELNRQQGHGRADSDVNTDAGFESYLRDQAKVSEYQRGEAFLRRNAPRPEAEPRGRGKAAPHNALGATTRRVPGEQPTKLSPQQLAAFLEGDGGTSVESGLEYGGAGRAASPPQRTAEEIRAEIRARDPESWDRATRMRAQMHSGRREASADRGELLARRLAEAIEYGDEAQVLTAGRQFYAEAPEAFNVLMDSWDEATWAQADAEGLDISDPEYPADSEAAGYQFGSAIRRSYEVEQASAQLARSTAMSEAIVGKSLAEYDAGLKALGIEGTPDGLAWYSGLRDYIYEGTGVNVGELSLVNPQEALNLVEKAQNQMYDHVRSEATTKFQASILQEPVGTSVSDGLTGPEDLAEARHRELMGALGVGPERVLAQFDPSLEIPEPEASDRIPEPETVGELRRELLEPEQTSVMASPDAWTRDTGEPTTYEEVSQPPDIV